MHLKCRGRVSKEEFISVTDFALLTGLTPKDIQGRYTVEVGGRHLVPHFMLAGKQALDLAQEVDSIDLQSSNAVDNEHYMPIASVGWAPPKLSNNETADELADFELNDAVGITHTPDTTPIARHQRSNSEKKKRRKSSRVYSRSEMDVLVSPYRRLLARTIDFTWECTVLAALGLWILTLGGSDQAIESVASSPLAMVLLSLLLIPLALTLDATTYSIVGNTPGKVLMRLKVVSRRLRVLGFSRYLERNFRLWGSGLSCGIVPISLFLIARDARRVSCGMQTGYDEKGDTRVGQHLKHNVLGSFAGATFVATVVISTSIVFAGLRS